MRRQPSRNRKAAFVAGFLGAISLGMGGGCAQRAPNAIVPQGPEAGFVGHVYVARLLQEHPLYEQAQHLARELAALQRGESAPVAPPYLWEPLGLTLPSAAAPSFPNADFGAARQEWELSLIPEPVTTPFEELAPDLAAELAWRQKSAARRVENELARARAAEEAQVAERRAAAIRARQEALQNAGLDLSIQSREAATAAAEEARARLWAEIEQETKKAQGEAEKRLAALQQRLQAEMEQELVAAEAEVRRRMEERRESSVKSGSEMKTRLSNILTPFEPWAWEKDVVWQPTPGLEEKKQEWQPSVVAWQQAERRSRQAQARQLSGAKARLEAAIYEAVALAVLRLAGQRNWQIALPPDEPVVGKDLTERLRPEVRRLFQVEFENR